MSRSALAKDFSGILEAVAWLQLLRCAFAGGFCGILGAFQRLFLWLQKAPLGTSLPSNVSQRPCQRLFQHSGDSSLASTASLRLRRRLLRHSGRFPTFQALFYWLQKATLGTSLPSNVSLAKDLSGILEAVAWLQLLRCTFAGGFCGILGAFQRLF